MTTRSIHFCGTVAVLATLALPHLALATPKFAESRVLPSPLVMTEKDRAQAVDTTAPGTCAEGDVDACIKLAEGAQFLFFGEGDAEMGKKSMEFYGRASALADAECKAGRAERCTTLGQLSEEGTGGVVNVPLCIEAYERGCLLGDPKACWSLAQRLVQGRGVAKDEARGRALAQRACDANVREACVSLQERYIPAALSKPPRKATLKPGQYRCHINSMYAFRPCSIERDKAGRTLLVMPDGVGHLFSIGGVLFDQGPAIELVGFLSGAQPFPCDADASIKPERVAQCLRQPVRMRLYRINTGWAGRFTIAELRAYGPEQIRTEYRFDLRK